MDQVAEAHIAFAHVAFAESVSRLAQETSDMLAQVVASLEAHGAMLDSLARRVKHLEETLACP